MALPSISDLALRDSNGFNTLEWKRKMTGPERKEWVDAVKEILYIFEGIDDTLNLLNQIIIIEQIRESDFISLERNKDKTYESKMIFNRAKYIADKFSQ